jgi:hypothetical protein
MNIMNTRIGHEQPVGCGELSGIFCAVLLSLHASVAARATIVSTPFGTSYQVNVDAAGQNIPGDAANEPSLCVDPTNPNRIAIGWRQFDTTNSNFRQAGWGYSTNGGLNWSFGGTLEANVWRSDPVLASDTTGRFYFLSLRLSEPYSCDLWRSTNGGVSWNPLGSAYGGDKPWMAIDKTSGPGHGHIYQAWDNESDTSDRDFTLSCDGGLTWTNPFPVPQTPSFGTLDIGPNGELYLIGWDAAQATRCWLYRSRTATNQTAPFNFDLAVPVDLGGYLLNGLDPNPDGLLGQVWVAVDRSTNQTRGNVYALCSTGGLTNLCDVMFARSTNGGASWSSPQRINTDSGTNAYHWFGTLSVAPNGRVDVCWYDTRNSSDPAVSELYYCYSLDGGLSWADNRAISPPFNSRVGWPMQNKIGDYIGMLSLDEAACIAYSATFNGEQDVYFVRVEQSMLLTNSIPDPGLNAAIRDALRKPVGPLTAQDLMSLTNLSAVGRRVSSLQGLEAAHNLTRLDLYQNYLTNVTLPPGLTNLTSLNLGGNQLSNLSLPEGLGNLTTLELEFNNLTSLTLPAGLTSLATLDLYYNYLSSLTLPAGLTNLTTLDLGFNNLPKLILPAGLIRLTTLYVFGNSLSPSFSLPAGLTNLANLDLYGNGLTGVTLPSGLTSLTNLDLGYNYLTSLSLPAGLTSLTSLNLDYSLLTRLTLPAGLTNLSTLYLMYNYLSNLTLPAGLSSLTTLYLNGNQLTNLVLSPELSSLSRLDLSQNRLASVSLPPGLTNLTFLDLEQNPLSNFVLPEPVAVTSLAGTVASLTRQGVSVYTYTLAVSLVSEPTMLAGAFRFTLTGPPAVYNIFSSVDLATWSQLGSVTNRLGATVVSDPQATNSSQKYYRAMTRLP